MTTVVAFNVAREPAAARILADGSVIWPSRKLPPAEDDHAALSAAVVLADGGELVGVTLGQGDPVWAAARGTTRVLRISDVVVGDDDSATAAALAAAVAEVDGADLVVLGDSEHHPGLAPALAGHLGWPCVLAAAAAARVGEGVEVTRRIGGVEETISARLPVVIAIVAEGEETSPPGMKTMLAARRLPVLDLVATDLTLEPVPPLEPVQTRPPSSAAARLFDGDPQQAVGELIKALRSEGVL